MSRFKILNLSFLILAAIFTSYIGNIYSSAAAVAEIDNTEELHTAVVLGYLESSSTKKLAVLKPAMDGGLTEEDIQKYADCLKVQALYAIGDRINEVLPQEGNFLDASVSVTVWHNRNAFRGSFYEFLYRAAPSAHAPLSKYQKDLFFDRNTIQKFRDLYKVKGAASMKTPLFLEQLALFNQSVYESCKTVIEQYIDSLRQHNGDFLDKSINLSQVRGLKDHSRDAFKEFLVHSIHPVMTILCFPDHP